MLPVIVIFVGVYPRNSQNPTNCYTYIFPQILANQTLAKMVAHAEGVALILLVHVHQGFKGRTVVQ